jgi:hypothetical protein
LRSGARPTVDLPYPLKTERKMCVVLQHHLGKGPRCAAPLHPPGHGPDQGIEPIPRQQTVSPVNHSQVPETSLSTCTGPWIRGLSRPP